MNHDDRTFNLIYFASFIDAEGYIEYANRKKANGRGQIYEGKAVRLEVTNTDFTIIQDMMDFFQEGHLYQDKPRKTATGKQALPILRYVTSYFKTYKVLKLVLPYMRHQKKLEKAHNIIEWYENENKQAVNRVKKYKEKLDELDL